MTKRKDKRSGVSKNLANKQSGITGTFKRSRDGKNYFLPDNEEEQLFVAERNSLHAQTGDRVRVVRSAYRKGQTQEGEVIEIIERQKDTFVGTLDVSRYYAFVETEDRLLANDIFIPIENLNGAKQNDRVVAQITEWHARAKNPIGRIIDILGQKGNNTAEMHAILAEFGLPYKYPVEPERAADEIADSIPQEEIARREDFRTVTTFTIDPHDAKDFDDAISLRPSNNGHWEVGVHIADVSHYVTESSTIDKEAYNRATSVYLVDRTIPMLPERLCNNICSLRPKEEKLTYSAIFTLDEDAVVKSSRICRTIIKSDRRFTYEEAQERIETGAGDYCKEIKTLDELAKKLRAKRFENGAINFERVEVRFDIDSEGKPLRAYFKESKDAHKLVEEFMLLANKYVAEHIGKAENGKKAKVFPYRIHEQPDPRKLEALTKLTSCFGYKINTLSGKPTDVSRSINSLMSKIKGKPEQNLIETVSIRSMAKARYSVDNVGHYGLAFPFYTHFTSPIRRYPDLLVHRLLARYDKGERSVSKEQYEEKCDHSSTMEQLAASAERASIKYKQVEFMQAHLGEEFEGIISGVTEWGMYVEIKENGCEGMVPMRDLTDDYYEFDETNYCLRGRRKGKTYTLGSIIRIKVARANLDKRQLDFSLV